MEIKSVIEEVCREKGYCVIQGDGSDVFETYSLTKSDSTYFIEFDKITNSLTIKIKKITNSLSWVSTPDISRNEIEHTYPISVLHLGSIRDSQLLKDWIKLFI